MVCLAYEVDTSKGGYDLDNIDTVRMIPVRAHMPSGAARTWVSRIRQVPCGHFLYNRALLLLAVLLVTALWSMSIRNMSLAIRHAHPPASSGRAQHDGSRHVSAAGYMLQRARHMARDNTMKACTGTEALQNHIQLAEWGDDERATLASAYLSPFTQGDGNHVRVRLALLHVFPVRHVASTRGFEAVWSLHLLVANGSTTVSCEQQALGTESSRDSTEGIALLWYSCGGIESELVNESTSKAGAVDVSLRVTARDGAGPSLEQRMIPLHVCAWDAVIDGAIQAPTSATHSLAAMVAQPDLDWAVGSDEQGADREKEQFLSTQHILQWIGYHLTVGFDFVTLYVDGDCPSALREQLRPFSGNGVARCVSTTRLPGSTILQHRKLVFALHAERYREMESYVLFASPDEYLAFSEALVAQQNVSTPLQAVFPPLQTEAQPCAYGLGLVELHPGSRPLVSEDLLINLYTSQRCDSAIANEVHGETSRYPKRQAAYSVLRTNCSREHLEEDLLSPRSISNAFLARFNREKLPRSHCRSQPLDGASSRRELMNFAFQTQLQLAKYGIIGGAPAELDVRKSVHSAEGEDSMVARIRDPFQTRDKLSTKRHYRIFADTNIRVAVASTDEASCAGAIKFAQLAPLLSWGTGPPSSELEISNQNAFEARQVFLLDAYLVGVDGNHESDDEIALGWQRFSIHFLVKYRGPFEPSAFSFLNQGIPFRFRLGNGESVACHVDPPPRDYIGESTWEVRYETLYGYHCDSFLAQVPSAKNHTRLGSPQYAARSKVFPVLENANLFIAQQNQRMLGETESNLKVFSPTFGFELGGLCEWDPALDILPPGEGNASKTNALVTMVDPEYSLRTPEGLHQPSSLERLPEWLAYHWHFGFDSFTVYVDGMDTTQVRASLSTFVATGRVRIIPTRRNRILKEKPEPWMRLLPPVPDLIARMRDHQRVVFSTHIDRYAKFHDVMMVLDVDEFVFLDKKVMERSLKKSKKKRATSGVTSDDLNAEGLTQNTTGHGLLPTNFSTPLEILLNRWRSSKYEDICQVRMRWWHFELLPGGNASSSGMSWVAEHSAPNASPEWERVAWKSVVQQFQYRRVLPITYRDRGSSKALFLANETTFYSNQHGAFKFKSDRCRETYFNPKKGYLAHFRYAKAQIHTPNVKFDSSFMLEDIAEAIAEVEQLANARVPLQHAYGV
ncbi:hypothetical protein FVE85_6457 [Porphyridium purpureum]|uniref:Glycosyltransferase family 92 protein n=1 Tax=Porphyridium purpureum TaxID=35688 RepID=A0A5J4Z731_PORPP|nr:hypothetical protein FVE85_6457 [Porphyridium purpureum]|eukprot:POR4692..scf295_1